MKFVENIPHRGSCSWLSIAAIWRWCKTLSSLLNHQLSSRLWAARLWFRLSGKWIRPMICTSPRPPTPCFFCLLIVACLCDVALSNLPDEGERAPFPNKSSKYGSICKLSACTLITGISSPENMWKDFYQYWFVFMKDPYLCSILEGNSKTADFGLFFISL